MAMASLQSLIATLFLLAIASKQTLAHSSIIQMYTLADDDDHRSYCESWKFSIEANNDVNWATYPRKCKEYVRNYIYKGRYLSDSEVVASYALEFAKTVSISTDGKDAWIFDIDETLLSSSAYHIPPSVLSTDLSSRSETFNNNKDGDLWILPALPASLKLYKEIEHLGFKIFLLTGRYDNMTTDTVNNLHIVGYSNWVRLILRKPEDEKKTAIVFKSEKRVELEKEGYRIQGNVGDQWSDLWGNGTAIRSFKLPNPLYYVV